MKICSTSTWHWIASHYIAWSCMYVQICIHIHKFTHIYLLMYMCDQWMINKMLTLMIIPPKLGITGELKDRPWRRYADLPSAMIPRMEKAVPLVSKELAGAPQWYVDYFIDPLDWTYFGLILRYTFLCRYKTVQSELSFCRWCMQLLYVYMYR